MTELIRGIHNIKPAHVGCVATIGNFDGVHLGHQEVLQQLIKKSKELHLPSLVITFEPLPREYFQDKAAPARISSFREKFNLLKKQKIDRVLCIRFNQSFAKMSAADFVDHILVKKLGIKFLIVGDDFRFGAGRVGDVELLKKLGLAEGFEVAAMETFKLNDQRVGSSRVRDALFVGDLKQAAELMGRPYCMSGRVIYGDQRGRLLGFPTANISLKRRVIPLQGVFAVMVYGLSAQPLPAVANVGRRPTVDGKHCLLEVHLLNFDQVIYGRFIEVEFIKKIRDEVKFESLDALKKQIAEDVEKAQAVF